MPDRPYTDDDLRTEAARQHSLSLDDPDFMGIGERMDGSLIASTVVEPDHEDTGTAWDEIDREDFDAAQHSIDDLLTSAADVSAWAINLGVDGLEPSTKYEITVKGDERPIVRVLFAFEPDMPDEMRSNFVEGIGGALATHL